MNCPYHKTYFQLISLLINNTLFQYLNLMKRKISFTEQQKIRDQNSQTEDSLNFQILLQIKSQNTSKPKIISYSYIQEYDLNPIKQLYITVKDNKLNLQQYLAQLSYYQYQDDKHVLNTKMLFDCFKRWKNDNKNLIYLLSHKYECIFFSQQNQEKKYIKKCNLYLRSTQIITQKQMKNILGNKHKNEVDQQIIMIQLLEKQIAILWNYLALMYKNKKIAFKLYTNFEFMGNRHIQPIIQYGSRQVKGKNIYYSYGFRGFMFPHIVKEMVRKIGKEFGVQNLKIQKYLKYRIEIKKIINYDIKQQRIIQDDK